MFSLRRSVCRPVAAVLLFAAAGIAGAQTNGFAPSVIGKSVVLEGQVEVLVEDYADGHSLVRHFLKTSRDRIPLRFAGKAPQLSSGSLVRVKGLAQSDALAVDGSVGSVQTLSTVLPNTMGEQSVVVLLINFQDDTSQPKTIADAQNLVFGDVNNHYLESSFGQTWFKGQAFGWYTIAMNKSACDPYKLATLADAQATKAGVNLANYQRRVYMFPKNACEWMGLGTVGGTNTQAWISGELTLQVVGHELGHNYGLGHAHSLDCDTGVFGNSCIGWEYGDTADLMGNNRAGQFNPFEKEELGWLNDGISPPITTVTTSGRYSIEPYSSSTVGPKALKIPRGTDGSGRKLWTYVEYRQPIGSDQVLGDAGNMTRGLMVRTATEGDRESSFQLDMSPGTSLMHVDELADGALEIGQSYYDGDTGITMALASAGSSGAEVDVQFGAPTCTRAAPSVWLGAYTSSAVPAGTTVQYQVKVTNRDSVACPATTFTLANSVPAGWTATFDMPSVTIKPGITGVAVLDVISTPTAALGSYKIGLAASSALGDIHTASAYPVDYVVITPCTRNAPAVALTGGSTGVRAGTRISYTVTVTNRDQGSSCGRVAFGIANSVPPGWTGTLHANTLYADAGASASTTLDVTSDMYTPIGTYGIGAATSSSFGAVHTASAGATYNVASTCTRAAPTITLTGGGNVVAPGTSVGYTLNVTNNDSSACPATTFALARSVPAGWAGTLSRPSIALVPGTTGSAALNVTSLTTSAGGAYGIGAAASSPIGQVHMANASATYNVAPRLVIADASINEGNAGTTMANFTVSLSNATIVPVTFDIVSKNATAAAGTDYTATSRTGVTIPAGSTSAVVSVPVIGDVAIEANETFQVVVGNAAGATVADGTAIGTIKNDDAARLSIGDVAIVEGNAGTRVATFTVKLTQASSSPVTFYIATANGTAAAGSDYAARPLVAQTIPAGGTSLTFAVNVTGDAAVEGNETFLVNVTGVKGAVVADAQAVGTIRNDDTVLTIADASVAEGQAGTKVLSFSVKLSAVSAVPVTFNLATADKTAAAGTDYVALALTGQSIPAGTTNKVFAVTIKGDTVREANETFVVNVGGVVGAVVGDAQALGAIVNDD